MSLVASPEKLWSQAGEFQRRGRLAEAAEVYRRFIALRPDVVEARVNLGNVLMAMGTHGEAETGYREALAVRRDLPEALFGLGNALKAQGRLEEAVAAYRAALSRNPNVAAVLYNLGSTLQAQGRTEQAITAFSRAIAVKPDFVQAHNNLGILYYDQGAWARAEEAFSRAMALQPGFVKARNNLGMALHKQQKLEDAEAAFREAIRQKPDYVEAFDNLGALLLETGRTRDAFDCFMCRAAVDIPSGAPATVNRLLHDEEQSRHRGRPPTGRLEIQGGERLAGPAINTRNNIGEISDTWRTSRPQIVVIDDLLTPEALDGLRRFCHGSTIWRDTFDGYLGARPQSGFACPLLAQVAEEFATAYPAIFHRHPLLFAWAFKYDQGMPGTRVHADFAAVNVNFWITPDDANEDPQTGGLLVWDVAAPLDWDFTRYNADEAAIRDFLSRGGAAATRIPYRANRAVIFDSDLFHETDQMSFRPGYENRRINITLLYGTRSRDSA